MSTMKKPDPKKPVEPVDQGDPTNLHTFVETRDAMVEFSHDRRRGMRMRPYRIEFIDKNCNMQAFNLSKVAFNNWREAMYVLMRDVDIAYAAEAKGA